SRGGLGLRATRIDDGAFTGNCPLTHKRLRRWRGASICVHGRPEWIFIKLYCHGFFTNDQSATIGEPAQSLLQETLEWADRDGRFKIHFATAREAFNIALAAVDAHIAHPRTSRNYLLLPITHTPPPL